MSVRPLFQNRTTNVQVSGIEYQLERIANALEALIEKPQIDPEKDFDVDDFCEVSYVDEEKELVEQHLKNRIGGIVVNDLGL